jgi:hypothetical protein
MFGENFCWWYSRCYEDQLVPLNWQAGRHIKWLMDWIERHADKGELEKWRIRAASMDDPGHAAAGVTVSYRPKGALSSLAARRDVPSNSRAQNWRICLS